MEIEKRPVDQPKCSGGRTKPNIEIDKAEIPIAVEVTDVNSEHIVSDNTKNNLSVNNKTKLNFNHQKQTQCSPKNDTAVNSTEENSNTPNVAENDNLNVLGPGIDRIALQETENPKAVANKTNTRDDNHGDNGIKARAKNEPNVSLPPVSSESHGDIDEGDSHKQETSTVDGENSLSPSTQSQTPPPEQGTTTTHTSIGAVMSVAASDLIATSRSNAAIPDTILSPPKSEIQTDDANTATSSSSPASDSQLSPLVVSLASTAALTSTTPPEVADVTLTTTIDTVMNSSTGASSASPKTTTKRAATITAGGGAGSSSGGKRVIQPINVVVNGTIPKSSGKPQMSDMNKKLKEKTPRMPRQRKQKTTVPIYESEISDNKTGIKLCIKKSDGNLATTTGVLTAPATSKSSAPSTMTRVVAAINAVKQTRKRSRKSKSKARLDSDDSEYEITAGKRGKKNRGGNAERQKKVSFTGVEEHEQKQRLIIEQGDWGARMPQEILFKIFEILIDREGCLPTLCRLGRVCALWRKVSLTPSLWKSMDLSTWIKEKYRTELRLKWFVDNRCSECTELNLANWKMSDINCFLTKLANGCPNLTSITLSGWKGFTSEHLAYLTENMQKLERLDLSSVNVEVNASKSAVGLQSLSTALQTMNGRLTHLYLAHNRLAGIPQIVTTLAAHCPNLTVLDLSNVTTQATSHGILHIEKLQHGCRKLKMLRVTNSHISWNSASMQETMDSAGFPELEELSVAALTDESRVIADEHLQRILKTSSKLKLLDVRGCLRLTHESLIRLPAWDIKHLFLSGCSVTRDVGSGLELIASKWAHSLIELDLAWANVQQPLDNALRALAEKGSESPLAHLNLCGSSVSDEAVKEILANCAHMTSINLSSCRGLPRGVKRLMQGPQELQELREVLKVQMKVKLPAQIKQDQEEKERQKYKAQSATSAGGDSGVGDGGGNSQCN